MIVEAWFTRLGETNLILINLYDTRSIFTKLKETNFIFN